MAAVGWTWCRDCQGWTSATKPRQGRCAFHVAAEDRRRYASDHRYRSERRQHAHARRRGVASIPPDAQADIMEDFGGRCAYCPAPATSWDHIIPVSRGGRTEPGNVVPCCGSCNSRKGNRDPDEWLDSRVGHMHPKLTDYLSLWEIRTPA